LRADVGEVDEALADWWQTFSQADEGEREDMLAQVRPSINPRGRTSVALAEADQSEQDPPKKRRRRRRKPGGGAGGASGDGSGANPA
jgi:poly(A) polymerase